MVGLEAPVAVQVGGDDPQQGVAFAGDEVALHHFWKPPYGGCELLGDLEHVAEVRQCGLIVAAELARGADRSCPFDWRERRGVRVYRHGLEHEALLRPIGNVVYFMPPYVITPDEIDALVLTARDGIVAATCD